jgi:carboxyl-terminal processing protease
MDESPQMLRPKRSSWRTTVKYAGAGLFIVFIFSFGLVVGTRGALWSLSPALASSVSPTPPPEGIDLGPLWTAWRILDERYVPANDRISTSTATTTPNGANDPQERLWGMIAGMAASMDDPYTVFLPPKEAEIFEADISGAFEGVGMEIAIRDGVLTIVSPLKDTPAFNAGLKAQDRIVKINGETTKGLDINEAVKKIRGPRGTAVEFSIAREGESEYLTISVTRDVINVPTIQTDARADGVFVIELLNFYADSPKLFAEALQDFIDSGYDDLIIDLRGNPGGYLQAAVDIGSWFIPAGKVVVTEDYGDKSPQIVHRSRGHQVFGNNQPNVVVLVDKGSASASEILSGALRHYGVAQTVGTATFGKGSVQELVPITPKTSLKITIARWLGPDGTQIPEDGLEPDVEVLVEEEDRDAGYDRQLEEAVKILKQSQ